MSEARRQPQAAPEARPVQNLSTLLSSFVGMFRVTVGGANPVTATIRPQFTVGQTLVLNAAHVAFLNKAYVDQATASAESALTTGTQKGLTGSARQDWLEGHVNGGHVLSVPRTRSHDVFDMAVERVLMNALIKAGKATAINWGQKRSSAEIVEKISDIKNNPALAEKFGKAVSRVCDEISGEAVVKR